MFPRFLAWPRYDRWKVLCGHVEPLYGVFDTQTALWLDQRGISTSVAQTRETAQRWASEWNEIWKNMQRAIDSHIEASESIAA